MLNWRHLRAATVVVSGVMAVIMGWLTAGWLLTGEPWWLTAWAAIVSLAWAGNAYFLHRVRPRS